MKEPLSVALKDGQDWTKHDAVASLRSVTIGEGSVEVELTLSRALGLAQDTHYDASFFL